MTVTEEERKIKRGEERERERQRERETDRQTDRERQSDRERQTDRQRLTNGERAIDYRDAQHSISKNKGVPALQDGTIKDVTSVRCFFCAQL